MPAKRASGDTKTRDVFDQRRRPAKMSQAAVYACPPMISRACRCQTAHGESMRLGGGGPSCYGCVRSALRSSEKLASNCWKRRGTATSMSCWPSRQPGHNGNGPAGDVSGAGASWCRLRIRCKLRTPTEAQKLRRHWSWRTTQSNSSGAISVVRVDCRCQPRTGV